MKRTIVTITLFHSYLFTSLYCFTPGTLIKTPSGYTPIEKLQEGDMVIAYDNASKELSPKKVTHRRTIYSTRKIAFQVGNKTIYTVPTQQFYDQEKWWVFAKDLRTQNFMCSLQQQYIIDDILESPYSNPTKIYIITVEDLHTFCITENDIIVHNDAPTENTY